MEFIEAPAFTRHVSEYMADDEYVNSKTGLRGIRNWAI
jgi:hypothetical protein